MRRSNVRSVVVGLAISALFVALVLSRVDLPTVAAALRAARPEVMAVSLGVLVIDLFIRAFRWRALLEAFVPVPPPVRRAAAYLTIGFMANAVLPARLGDVARAYLAGNAFGAPRLATLGTVVVERVSDGLIMVVLALLSSALVVGAAPPELRDLGVLVLILAAVGAVGAGIAWVAVRRGPLAGTRVGTVVASILARLGTGAVALRSRRGASLVVGSTAAAAVTATVIWWLVTTAVGLHLTAEQAVLVSSGTALSLAIPAAPSSVGTFEFAGVVILTAFGATPEVALAAILLVRLSTTIPMALVGLVVAWATHLRPGAIVDAAEAQGAADGEAEPGAAVGERAR